jgi:hypothetical protein
MVVSLPHRLPEEVTMSAASRTGRHTYTRPVVRPLPRPTDALRELVTW